ncbi:hypothetical protein ACJMK2_025037 [Sinanodonta woodiana]|uniref:Multiple epidermal growth factor-like domains protein 10 n=1 Tax=Sinanodonta woodiana TaxID=1069815 RepID=A0ABD3XJ43_SINWO
MEVRDLLSVTVTLLYAIAVSRGQDAPRDGGPNICHITVSDTVLVTVTYNEPYTYKTTTWCLAFPPRCSQYFTKYKLSYRVEQRTTYRTINKCCDGYKNVSGLCLAQCTNDCNGQGACVAPGICRCSPGFKGNNCESTCVEGTWGPNCDRKCNCNGHGTCNTMDGRCMCAAGYTGENCQTVCHNSFGVNCQIPCACQNGAACDHVTGACTCAPGFYGPLCHLICPPGTHGDSCQNKCLCQNGGQCHPVTGTCNCTQVFGYSGAYCNEPCPDNKWGFNCNSTCPVCYNGKCKQSTGKCECYFGYGGDDCQTQCQPGYYGNSCQIQCPCQNGGTCYQNPEGGDIACNCSAGYIGKYCNQTCPCDNGARCYYTITGIIGCDCLAGFIGDKCNIRACPPNKYGINCDYDCQCVQNSTKLCHPNTGHCLCKPGWQGDYCNQPCSFPYYGENCAKVCDCLNNGNCDHITGQCECQPGYKGVRCEERCDDGTFGVKCQEKCACKNGASCDPTNGRCICTAGWNGTFCESPCVGYYGLNCASTCLCSSETSICDPFDGTCRCKSGYTGKLCTEQCSAWKFGIQCSQFCSSYCDQNTSLGCHHVTGECICMPGWSGLNCKSTCPNTMWGPNCQNKCNCTNDGTCDSSTGSCICPPGYQGTLCEQKCGGNRYGKDCALKCPACGQYEQCNPVTGVCELASCPPGYTGFNCKLSCPPNTYGQNCSGICSKDCDSTKAYCDAVTGKCVCYPGFYGPYCQYSCPTNKFGQDCKYDCACENGLCRPYDGHCHCYAGYTGVMCSQSCPPSMYGILCNQTCHCMDTEYCSPVYGCILKPSANQQVKENEVTTAGISFLPVIIGVAVAAAVLFVLLIFFVLYFRRRVSRLKLQNSAIMSFSKERNNISTDMFGVDNPTYDHAVEENRNRPQASLQFHATQQTSCCSDPAEPEENRYTTLKSLNGTVGGLKDGTLPSNYTNETYDNKVTEKKLMFHSNSKDSSSDNGACGGTSPCDSLPAGKTDNLTFARLNQKTAHSSKITIPNLNDKNTRDFVNLPTVPENLQHPPASSTLSYSSSLMMFTSDSDRMPFIFAMDTNDTIDRTTLHREDTSLYATLQRSTMAKGQQSIMGATQGSPMATDQTSPMATQKSESRTLESSLPETEKPGIYMNLTGNGVNEGSNSSLYDTPKSVPNEMKGLYSTPRKVCIPNTTVISSKSSQEVITMEASNNGEDDNVINTSLENAVADLEGCHNGGKVKNACKSDSQGHNKGTGYDIYESINDLHIEIDEQQKPVQDLIKLDTEEASEGNWFSSYA